ncbi:ABC transporter permease [Chloroflexota bacterium]
MANDSRNTLSETVAEPKRRSFLVDLVIRLVKEKPLGTIGGIIVLILFLTGIFADLLAPYGMNQIHLIDRLSGPSPQYLLGTDHLGRDILSNIIYGARISMIIGLCATTVGTFLATAIGSISGLVGGKFDLVVQRFVDAWMSMPQLLILLTVMTIVGRGMAQIIFVIGITSGIRVSRLVRGATISIRENVYMEAAEAIGCSFWRLLTRHILPNILAVIVIDFTIRMGAAIMMEASLSFLGFGVPPGVPSWGSMLSGEGRQFMEVAPQLAIWPGLSLSIVVYGINMFGDALRDLMDPRLRGGIGRYTATKGRKKLEEKVKE